MKNLLQLKQEAIASAIWRGHHLLPWSTSGNSASTTCARCGMGVYVNVNPAPNGIQLSGEAIALHCPQEEVSNNESKAK